MATPLRLLLFTPKKQLSISPIRKVKSCGSVSRKDNKYLQRNRCTAVRRLDFTKNDSCSVKLPEIRINNNLLSPQRAHKYFAISTPEKRDLLKCGLRDRATCHVIGAGSFGTVIEAKYKGDNVAVKITKPKSFSDIPERYMLDLSHENIIKTLDVICGNNYTHCMIIMEYIENTISLNCVLEDNSFDTKFAVILKIAIDVCKGLRYLHENNLIHLDVKPANVLMCPTGLCKLCDFGSCMKINSEKIVKYEHKGTVIYTPPEILLGKVPTVKSDVYSLGILMWQLVTRETPFPDIDCSEILIYKVVKYTLRPNTATCERNAYTQLFCDCWEADPSIRPELSVVIEKLKEMQ